MKSRRLATRRQMTMTLGLLMALALGREAEAARMIHPLDVQGLELADGRLMPRVPVEAWGQTAVPAHPGLDGLRQDIGRVWVDWDAARRHAAGLITTGVAAPGTVISAAQAEAFTLDFLERHLAVLAPGSHKDDFMVVANDLSSGIRTVGLAQYSSGRPVLGGQLSVRFKADRLVYVASQALPDVDAVLHSGPALDPDWARTSALAWVEDDYPDGSISARDVEGPFILPIWSPAGFSYHEVVSVTVDSAAPLGRWTVYLEAGTGDPVAREQQLRSVATVRYNVPERYPGSTRYDAVAPQVQVSENGMGSVTNLDGEVALNNDPTTLTTEVFGPLVNVTNAAGPQASASFPIVDGGTLVWNDAGDQFVDAQLSAFIHASATKAYIRDIDPGLNWLDGTVNVSVNQNGECNAASNGDDLFFLQGGGSCENTARLADVVHHEMGHSVHAQSLIQGVGSFEGALSEGISDYLAATMVNDSGMGRGFTYSNDPLRELDPDGFEWTWPEDKGESHTEGQIIGGTLWDLRVALMASLGDVPGREHTDRIYYEGHRRAVNIPTMYPEALVYDDDDGNLANGTPNICEINAAFEAHGLLDPSIAGDLDVDFSQVFEGGQVTVATDLPAFAGCPLELTDATLRWRERGEETAGDEISMALEDGVWLGTIPPQDTGVVVEYQVQMTYSNGEQFFYPRNAADPWYQAFFGAVQPIYCFDGDADPGEWTFGGTGNNWNFGPLGESGIDPSQPWDDDGALISQDGTYQSGSNTSATSPSVDISESLDVRLHYRRWLTVEDAFFDQARIRVNGQTRWTNLATGQANVHHLDREWRFHDLPLNDFIEDGQVELEFQLDSDGGLQFGGWTMDALCVVEVVPSICGDGAVSGDEECDDGNTEDGDGCDAQCITEEVDPDPTGGVDDTTGDSMGGTSIGSATGGPGTNSADGTSADSSGDAGQDGGAVDEGCGCTSGGSGFPLHGAWLLLAVGAVRRRRTSR